MKIISSHEKEKLASLAFTSFLEQLHSFRNQRHLIIGLSGGTSLLAFYEALRNFFPFLEPELRKKIRFVFLDERLVPLDHPDSNYRLLSGILFAPLLEKKLLSEEQIFAVRTDITDPVMEYFSRVPHIDIGLFGVGPDGHIASLFPNHPGLQDKNNGYIMVHDSPKPPSDRISISIPYVRKICSVFVFFIGEGKREAYERFLDTSIREEQCPAKYLLGCEDCVVVTDLEG
ncbi:MAG: 6-phosphogluconolactonase [Candidatus Gracilibacteria bacterium]|nr:6-phosphogluconolactonase [Candidatus Gracilibacteria bacterium]